MVLEEEGEEETPRENEEGEAGGLADLETWSRDRIPDSRLERSSDFSMFSYILRFIHGQDDLNPFQVFKKTFTRIQEQEICYVQWSTRRIIYALFMSGLAYHVISFWKLICLFPAWKVIPVATVSQYQHFMIDRILPVKSRVAACTYLLIVHVA